MSLFPRAFASEFAPMFRLLDDYASHTAATRGAEGLTGAATGLSNFQPRFDVKENTDAYELHGELPGVKRENLSIEFTDNHTLSIKGRTEYHREEGTRPDLIEGGESSSAGAIEDAPSGSDNKASQYHKASVEDEAAMSGANPEAPHSETAEAKQVTKQDNRHKKHKKHTGTRYWVSERSVGTFQRSFQFPTRVDQDNVKASLQDGILSIIVPKASAPQAKRITVE